MTAFTLSDCRATYLSVTKRKMVTVWYIVHDITVILNNKHLLIEQRDIYDKIGITVILNNEQLLIEQCYIYDKICNTIC